MYLNQLWARPAIKGALSSALGGLPTAFRTEVERDIKHLKDYNLNPRFMFDGLDLLHFQKVQERKDKKYKADPTIARRRAAWDAWMKLAEKGRFADAADRAELDAATRDAFEAGSPPLSILYVSYLTHRVNSYCAHPLPQTSGRKGIASNLHGTRDRGSFRTRLCKSPGTRPYE